MKLYDLLFEYTSYENMVTKLQSIYILMSRGATEGERSASKSAYDRILASISREYGESQAKAAEAKVKGRGQSGASGGSTYRSKAKPQEPPKQKRKSSTSGSRQGSYGGQNHFYHDDRTGWSFYIVRFTDPEAGKRGSDKIWGYATKNGEFMSFWGAYGKSIRTKPLSSDREASTLLAKKAAKGYRRVDIASNPSDYAYIFNQFN